MREKAKRPVAEREAQCDDEALVVRRDSITRKIPIFFSPLANGARRGLGLQPLIGRPTVTVVPP